jgi:hypothetical protein
LPVTNREKDGQMVTQDGSEKTSYKILIDSAPTVWRYEMTLQKYVLLIISKSIIIAADKTCYIGFCIFGLKLFSSMVLLLLL